MAFLIGNVKIRLAMSSKFFVIYFLNVSLLQLYRKLYVFSKANRHGLTGLAGRKVYDQPRFKVGATGPSFSSTRIDAYNSTII